MSVTKNEFEEEPSPPRKPKRWKRPLALGSIVTAVIVSAAVYPPITGPLTLGITALEYFRRHSRRSNDSDDAEGPSTIKPSRDSR